MKYEKRAYGGIVDGKHEWEVVGINDVGGYTSAHVYTETGEPPTMEAALEALAWAQGVYFKIVLAEHEKLQDEDRLNKEKIRYLESRKELLKEAIQKAIPHITDPELVADLEHSLSL